MTAVSATSGPQMDRAVLLAVTQDLSLHVGSPQCQWSCPHFRLVFNASLPNAVSQNGSTCRSVGRRVPRDVLRKRRLGPSRGRDLIWRQGTVLPAPVRQPPCTRPQPGTERRRESSRTCDRPPLLSDARQAGARNG